MPFRVAFLLPSPFLLVGCRFFSSHRTVMSFQRPTCRCSVSCRIRLHYVWRVIPVWKYGLPCSPFRFCLASSRRIVSSPRHVSSFRLVPSLRLVSTRTAIRFARYGRREGGAVSFDYSYVRRFLNNFVLFFNPASIWWNIRPASFFHIS